MHNCINKNISAHDVNDDSSRFSLLHEWMLLNRAAHAHALDRVMQIIS